MRTTKLRTVLAGALIAALSATLVSAQADDPDSVPEPAAIPGWTNFGYGYSWGRSFEGPTATVDSTSRKGLTGVSFTVTDKQNTKLTTISYSFVCWNQSTGNVTWQESDTIIWDPPIARTHVTSSNTDNCKVHVKAWHTKDGFLSATVSARYP